MLDVVEGRYGIQRRIPVEYLGSALSGEYKTV